MEHRLPFRIGRSQDVKKVDVQKEYRYVTPAVRLERRQVSMLNPPPPGANIPTSATTTTTTTTTTATTTTDPATASDTASTSDANTRIPIVGEKGPQDERTGSSLLPRAPPPTNGQSPRHSGEEPATARAPTSKEREEPPAAQELSRTTEEEQEVTKPRTRTPTKGTRTKEEEEEEEETRTQELTTTSTTTTTATKHVTKEATQVTRQELVTKEEPQELKTRTCTTSQQQTQVRTTTTTKTTRAATKLEQTATGDDGSKSPTTAARSAVAHAHAAAASATRPTVQFTELPPARLETANVIEFFEEQASSRKDTGVQIAEQSMRQETTTVMEFFEEQPVRQDSVQVVQHHHSKQETANVIEFFEEQEHSLDEGGQPTLLVVPSPHQGSFHHHHRGGGPRSPSPSSLHASVGLNHLDNLIRLMEQLSNLKDENVKLRKKCDYLETTKNLLKARSELMSTSDSSSASGFQSLPARRQKGHFPHHHHHHHRHHHSRDDDDSSHGHQRNGRPRLSSAEDVQCMEISESASDGRPKRPKGAMHKRSFSTGSLEVEIMDETSASEGRIPKSKSGKSVFGAKSPKQKSKSSKWARVKKVLTGQFWYEDLGTTLKSLKELGRSAQRYSTVSTEGHDFGSSSSSSHRLQSPRSLHLHQHGGSMGSGELPTSSSSSSRLPRVQSASAEASSVSRPPLASGSGQGPGSGLGGDVEELGTEIWMGPPGWWEQYEASKRQNEEASNSSDVSSVIEVKTMYLGSKQKDTERLLRVKPLARRQSSPSLSTKSLEGGEDDEGAEEGEEGEDGLRPIHRSSSYKGEELDLPHNRDLSASGSSSKSERDSTKKLHKKAWGRVKEMIHVRKDSVKKRSRREARERGSEGADWSQGEETSEVDLEGMLEEQLSAEFGEGIISRSTPKTSPMIMPRQAGGKGLSESPPQGLESASSPFASLLLKSSQASSAPGDVASLLAGSMSEEFAQKMHAWHELQLKKSSSFRSTTGEVEGEGPGVDGAGETQELLPSHAADGADRSKVKGGAPQVSETSSTPAEGGGVFATLAPPSEVSPTEPLGPAVNVEELQRRISESFSRKLAEWERRKYRRPTTPEMEPKSGRNRKEKEERTRSKKSREEKERERLEKAREREMQKVEKEQVKLEKEKVRIEKERLRAMERQAKLERMKGRLSQADGDPPSGSLPSDSPAQDAMAQYRVTADFKRKLHEWEQMKGPSAIPEAPGEGGAGDPSRSSSSPPPPAPSFTLGPATPGAPGVPPLSLHPYFPDSPEERSPVDKVSDVSYNDDSTSVTEESLTKGNIGSLERANEELLREVQRKEHEYSSLQEEVYKLNSKLDKVRQEHAAEMARFRRELEAGVEAGPVQLEVGELESTVREVEEKIALMENAGDQLAESMESAAIGKWQSIEGEEVVSQQLVDMVDQMKGMLVQASVSKEQAQKTLALHNFETVYSHAMKLQVQMNNLRVSQLERNKEIMLIKRQLLLQEVNNVLLQAHITRRETELYQYREARRHGTTVRRWNTFSGQGDNEARPPLLRNISLQESEVPLSLAQLPSTSAAAKHSAKHDDIPYITDEDASIPTAGVARGRSFSTSARKNGASPAATTTTTAAAVAAPPPPLITMTAPTPEKSTDHREQHLASPAAATTTTTTTVATSRAANTVVVNGAATTKPQPPLQRQLSLVDENAEENVQSSSSPAAAKQQESSSPKQKQRDEKSTAAETTMTTTTTTTSTTPTAATATAAATTTATSPRAKSDAASKVETGSPTLLAKASSASEAPVPQPAGSEERPREEAEPRTETPATTQPIPRRPGEPGPEAPPSPPSAAPASALVDDTNYSQTQSVMECTESAVEPQEASGGGLPQETKPGGGRRGGEKETTDATVAVPEVQPSPPSSPSQASAATAGEVVDISSKGAAPRAVRSPVSRQKYLRRQKEEREKRKERAASPKTPPSPRHTGDSGKPPLPPQSTPHQSPVSHRSKSVGDMEDFQPESAAAAAATPAPLRDVIQKFEKRATVCETEERKIEFRKTPSPTLHLPRVGLVSRVRRLKPAAELLQESQRYRSGHSIYATRIMNRYLPGPQQQQQGGVASGSQDKENLAGRSYVQAMVKRLSREGTPVKSAGSSSTNSSLSLHRTDSPGGRASSELVSQLIHKLSTSPSPHGPVGDPANHKISPTTPLKDRTNDGQVKQLTQAFTAEEAGRLAAESQGVSPPSDKTAKPDSSMPDEEDLEADVAKTSSSMPALASDEPVELSRNGARERAATYCVSESDRPHHQHQQKQQSLGSQGVCESIEEIAEEFLDPGLLSARQATGRKISPSSSTKSKNTLCCQSSACGGRSKSSSKSSPASSSSPLTSQASAAAASGKQHPSSPKSPDRRKDKEKMRTIGVLCKQSMSFDLGVSLRATSPEATPRRPQSAESIGPVSGSEAGAEGGKRTKTRPSSTGSDGEAATPSSDDKKKSSRSRFLDSSWLQKPKKFFKVSK